MLRKLMIIQQIDTAIKNGITQIVFIGGGFDIRSFITALMHPDITIYELDRGPTRQSKLNGLTSIPQEIGFDQFVISEPSDELTIINKNLYYIEGDLNKHHLSEILKRHGYNEKNKTLMIAEGLTTYLEQNENQQLLFSISHLMNEGDQLLISLSRQVMTI